MRGFNVFRKDRLVGKGGRVLLYVKSHLKCHKPKLHTAIQLECVSVNNTLSTSVCTVIAYVYIKNQQPKQISMINLESFLTPVTTKKK